MQVSRIERGAVLARVDTLVDLAGILGIRLDDLVGRPDPASPMDDGRLIELVRGLVPEDRRAVEAVVLALTARGRTVSEG